MRECGCCCVTAAFLFYLELTQRARQEPAAKHLDSEFSSSPLDLTEVLLERNLTCISVQEGTESCQSMSHLPDEPQESQQTRKGKSAQNKKNNWKPWSILERRLNLFIFQHRLSRNHFLSLKMVAWRWLEQHFWFRPRFIEPRSQSSMEAVQAQGRNANGTSMWGSFPSP